MPRPPRRDEPGAVHHVMHRAIARRTAFENRADVRYFLSRVVREIRRGEIRVHAYAVVHTHFHLLVESVRGRLSDAMRRILNAYVRWFNRSRKRDGPLFRTRFKSKRVETNAYRSILHSYIDDNPVKVGLVKHAEHYPYGSARCYARADGPIWLAREWAESEVRTMTGCGTYTPRDYPRRFPPRLSPSQRAWVERRLTSRPTEDELDDLIGAPAARVLEWMCRKAALADGTPPFQPIVPPETVEDVVARMCGATGEWETRVSGRVRNAWELVLPGLLRDGGGLRLEEIALRLQLGASTVRRRILLHRAALEADDYYACRAARIMHAAIQRSWPGS